MTNGFLLGMAVMLSVQGMAQETWRRSFGGHASDLARSIIQTSDGGYITAGATGSFGIGGDAYIVKLNAAGELEWSAYHGGDQVDEATAIVEVEGGYMVAGLTTSPSNGGYDGLLMRLGTDGTLLWSRNYGGPDWDMFHGMDVNADGLFVIGTTYEDPASNGQLWVLHLDLNGDIIWTARAGGPGEDEGRAVRSTSDGGCVVVGSFEQIDHQFDAYLLKLDENGSEQFSVTLGTDSLERGYGVDRTADGAYVLCGTTNGYEAYSQILVARVSTSGEVISQDHIGQGSEWEGRFIREKPDGGLAIAASTSAFGLGRRDMYLLWTDGNGYFVFGTTYGGSQDDVANSLALTNDGGYVLAGYTESVGPGPRAVFVVKTGVDGLTSSQTIVPQFDPVNVGEPRSHGRSVILNTVTAAHAPWQLSGVVSKSSYRLLDTSGRCLRIGAVNDSRIPSSGLRPGIYIVEIHDIQGASWTSRVIVSSE